MSNGWYEAANKEYLWYQNASSDRAAIAAETMNLRVKGQTTFNYAIMPHIELREREVTM